MNLRHTLFSFLVVLLSAFAAAAETPHELRGKHLSEKLVCADCHKTETPTERPAADVCFSCHKDYPELAERTREVKPNPHASHYGELRCGLCHRMHEPSVSYCEKCHEDEFELHVK